MNILLKVSAIAIVYIFLSLLLKSGRAEYVFLLRVTTILLIFLVVSKSIANLISNVTSIFSVFNIDAVHIETLLKVAGISIISDYVCDTLNDSNESSLAKVVGMTAKMIILAFCLPMLNSIIIFSLKILEQ